VRDAVQAADPAATVACIDRDPAVRRCGSGLAADGVKGVIAIKARELPVDEVFLDLEDAVAPAAKAQARANAAAGTCWTSCPAGGWTSSSCPR